MIKRILKYFHAFYSIYLFQIIQINMLSFNEDSQVTRDWLSP